MYILPSKFIIYLFYIFPEILIFFISIFFIFKISFFDSFSFNFNIKYINYLNILYLFLVFWSFSFFCLIYFKKITSPLLISNCYIICLYSSFMKFLIFLYFFMFSFILRNYYSFLVWNLPKEFFFFNVISSLFICMILSSFNIFFLFICFEGLTLSSIVLIAILGQNFLSLESLLNYFFISAVSSVSFIFGTSILFLNFNSSLCFSSFRLGFDENNFFLKNNNDVTISNEKGNINLEEFLNIFSNTDYISLFGIFLIIFFFLIKLGMFPFHFWVPKFFNSIWFFLFFFIVIIKFSFIIIFFRIFGFFCFNFNSFFIFIFYLASLGSIIVGCFGALSSNNLKYFISFTSINNLGYIFMGFSTPNFYSIYYSFLFFFIYSLNFIFFFISLIIIKKYNFFDVNIFFNGIYFSKLNNLIKNQKNFFLSVFLLVSFFSISGLPPFASFVVKLNLLNEIWFSGNYLMVIISLITSFFSIFYYFKLIKFLLKVD